MHFPAKRWVSFLILLYYYNEHIGAECEITSEYTEFCPSVCEERRKDFVTCTSLEEIHSRPDICELPCEIKLNGRHDILRTNSFPQLDNLRQLFLNNTSIGIIESGAFSGCPSVNSIHLEKNQITKISNRAFYQLKDLIFLNLSYNNIDEMKKESLSSCKSLQIIDFSHNNIRTLSPTILDSPLQLKTLNLSHNSLETINPDWCFHFHFLKNLMFDHNKIESLVNCSSNSVINFFSISFNSLSIINGTHFPKNLEILNLGGNQIEIITNRPFQQLSKLKILNLDRNKINNLPFELFVDLKNLTHLDLSFNNLISLKLGVFHGLFALKLLDLSYNKSPFIDTRTFYSTTNLTSIDISGNKLTTLDIETLLRICTNLRSLSLNENCFTCPELTRILFKSAEKLVNVQSGSSSAKENLNGIACSEEEFEIDTKKSNQEFDFFDKGFRKTSFYKFFSSFKYPNKNDFVDLIDTQKNIFSNISQLIEKSENKLLKIFNEQQNDRIMSYNNDILQKLLKVMELNKSKETKNITNELYEILMSNQRNNAALKYENTDVKNLASSLNSLEIMLVVLTLIFITFCFVKLYKQYICRFPVNRFPEDNQEMPIVERYNIQMT